ncbi:MAG: ergothioneine biosynthesis protein EgtB [Myxococcota bacterium]
MSPPPSSAVRATLLSRFRAVRARTEALCKPLTTEDYVVQSMPDASPAKWSIGHTSWYFETFVLKAFRDDHEDFQPLYGMLFNSYYNAVGPQWDRPRRGLLSRPTVDEVWAYRRRVDAEVERFIETAAFELVADAAPILEIGANHEEQHQELLLTDIKHAFAGNPLRPSYRDDVPEAPSTGGAGCRDMVEIAGGLVEIGVNADYGFHYDNEGPRHRAHLEAFGFGRHLVTNREFQEFMDDDGYRRNALWLSDGWATVQERGWHAPLYWEKNGEKWFQMTLRGFEPVQPESPVCHVSFYEADAFARWAGLRLPTEQEWEHAAMRATPKSRGTLLEDGRYHPDGRRAEGELLHVFGEVWEWTASAYRPYPGYRPLPGALGEYNGKFMSNQMVLRGGSCATPEGHIRKSYRNFFQPDKRWQFSGLRLAADRR